MKNQNSTYSFFEQVNKLCRGLGISEKQKLIIFNNYQVSESEEKEQITSIVRSYLRGLSLKKREFEEGFSLLEWVIVILFYENNFTIGEISLMVNESLTTTKLNFFLAKEKLLVLRHFNEVQQRDSNDL